MYTTQQNSLADDHIRAGYYPDHERVVELERMADGITELEMRYEHGTGP
jgi:hypothetical protein